MLRASPILALCVAALFGCASTPPVNPEAPVVKSLRIEGNEALSDSAIRERILTGDTSWLPFSTKHYYDEGVLETDLKRILRLYQAQGYYQARIAERRVAPANGDAVTILIRIEEGPPTRVRKLSVTGLEALPKDESQRLLRGLPLAPGEVFTEEDYDAFRNQLAERLHEAGFAEAEVKGEVKVELADDAADVRFQVETGLRFRYGQVFVAGANRVSRARIMEIVRDVLPAGALYRASSLAEAESRLFDLGVFSGVKVARGAPDRRAATVPIVVSVREAPFRTLRFAAGVGVDPTRTELPRLAADWTSRNFFGGLRRLTFSNQASLVFLSFPGGLRNAQDRGVALNSSLEFEQPNLFHRNLTLTNTLAYEHGFERAFQFDAVTGNVGVVWRLSRHLTVVPSYNLSLFGLSLRAGTLDEVRGAREAALDECAAREPARLCVLAYLEQRITWDRRDNPIAPTRGGLLSLSFQEGSRALGGGYDYLRILPEVRAYFPLGPHVLATRAMAGVLLPSASTTSSVLTRFYLGGSASQRGFGNRELSPRLAVQRDGRTEALPVGGDGMLLGSVELRFALPANLGLVTFLDAGSVTLDARDLSLRGLQYAVGAGLRYRTPFGPVRLDVGYRLTPAPYRAAGEALGGRPAIPVIVPEGRFLDLPAVDSFAIHFSIGEAF